MGADQALVLAELRAAGQSAVLRPPNTADDFTVQSTWTPAWVASAPGQALVRAVLSYQTASGGWGKHIDYAKGPRTAGSGYNSESDEWAYVGTIDNGATVNELRLLAVAASADTLARTAFLRGVDYLLDAQFPSGCWPQVYPLMGSYHDAATNNDNATVNVMRLLRDVGRGTFAFVGSAVRTRAASAVSVATSCLLASQVVARGIRTTWGQQHDPITLAPTTGRSYELPSLAGQEGGRVMEVLMEEATPSAALVEAVHAAATFYRATAIPNVRYVSGVGLVAAAGAGPVWARMLEIDTFRPIFANRDGIKLYDFNQLTDRRTGYSWYGTEVGSSLRLYDSWARTHPRVVP
jgi:PelA/Pel-15E family pectate lyase